MERKLIFLDIDGTLIPAGSMEAPASAVRAIRTARANGHKVFLCTGRNHRMTAPLLEYGFDGFICSAGGYVVCGGETLFDCPMEPALRDAVRASFERNGIACTLEARDMTFGDERMRAHFARFQEKSGVKLSSEAERWRKVFAEGMLVRPIEEYAGEPVYKICYRCDTAAQLDEPRAELEPYFVFCGQNMPGDGGGVNGELINRRFNKGSGIRAICGHLGMELADTIGFGDSMNDLEMTDVVGVSVCMDNGAEELKKRCDRVCPCVEQDGVAREFEALGLI